MNILVAADMEGISGVVDWNQVTPGNSEYVRFRKVMTDEVNAAVKGAFEGGAEKVIVTDGHSSGNNIMIEELDPRARLHSGTDSPYSMMEGVDQVDGVIMIGYHARAGTKDAILDHTYSSKCVANAWLNDTLIGETGLNAALCVHFNVPVIMITGDNALCREAMELINPIEMVIVKQATSRQAAECLSAEVVQENIFSAAKHAVESFSTRQGQNRASLFGSLKLATPIEMIVQFNNSVMADRAAFMPTVERVAGRRIKFTAEDMPTAYKAFVAAVTLAAA